MVASPTAVPGLFWKRSNGVFDVLVITPSSWYEPGETGNNPCLR